MSRIFHGECYVISHLVLYGLLFGKSVDAFSVIMRPTAVKLSEGWIFTLAFLDHLIAEEFHAIQCHSKHL